MLHPEYPVRTDRLLLRPFRGDDLDGLYAIQSLPAVARYLYWEARTLDEVRIVLADRIKQDRIAEEGEKLNLALQRRDTGALIGDVNLVWLSRPHRQGEIGFDLHPDHHGQGFAREATIEMLRLGFENLGLHRIIGRCDGRNRASARVLEKLGMRREAHLRENEIVKGEWTDEMVYAMLRSEWARPGELTA